MAQFKQWFTQDLTESIVVRHCESVMFTGDDNGAVVGVRLFDGGSAYSSGGTVSGAVKRSDGGLVPLTGTLSGNAASVVIPAAALAYPGPIGVHVVLTQGGSTTTVLKAIYSVDDNSGAAVDPGTIIPSINDLITAINNAVASIPSDYSALLHTLAPDFSASTAYAAGDYVWYNGTLYRFGTGHAAGSWTGTDATAAVFGNDLTVLKDSLGESVESAAITPNIDTTSIGVTVKASNNKLVIYGTANATRRYTFLNGQNEFHTTGDALDVTLDGGVYEIEISETGYKTNVPFNATYSTFASAFMLTSGAHSFATPVMIGLFISNGTNYGTSDNPTIISFSAKKVIAKDPIARTDIAEILSEIINLSEDVPAVPNNTDYNDLITTGTYRVLNLTNANTMANIPAGIGAHKLVVFKISDGQKIYQILLRSGSVNIYIRNKDGLSAWTDWRNITFSNDLVSLISANYNYLSTSLESGTDYDSVGAGSYYCASSTLANSMVHCPVKVGHRLFVFQTYNASDFVQIVMANREFYYRYRGEAWKTYSLYKPDVPTYYADHIVDREEKANAIIANVGIYGDTFAAIADTHWDRNAKNSPDLIKHIATNTPINRLMMLGDYYITQSTEAGAFKALNTCLGAFKDKGMQLYIIPGNHDYNKGTIASYPVLTESQVYGQIMTGQYDVTCDDETCSFWFDNAQKKIRYFFTTCMYDSSYNKTSYKWIFGEMENLPSGYRFIIFTHTGLSGSLSTSHEYSQYLTGAMAAVRDKTTYTFDGMTFDYSNVNATPMFVYAGHNHFDNVFTYNGIACIQETTDAYYYEEGGLTRTQGAETEQAFDIVTSDLQNSVVYLTRVGAGHDRIVHYGVETVTATKALTAMLTGSLVWASSDNRIANVSSGTVSKVGNGYCTVTATDTNGQTEDWIIKC